MYKLAEKRLSRLINAGQQHLLLGGRIGLEKEALRVALDGNIAHTPHPTVLGSPLTNPWITTDFSEALIEFITPPHYDMQQLLRRLCATQAFVYGKLEDELLWSTSMPCVLAGETSIPIAKYGRSNAGFMKHVYRRGLGYRYGRVMQTIAGIHFNYSFSDDLWPVFQNQEQSTWLLSDFISEMYFSMLRNLQRFGWLIPYLFGCSPAVCKSFVGDQQTDMEYFDASTYYYPYATSLRMGDIGYQNNKEYEAGFKACYDNLNVYIASLTRAIETPYPKYQDIGVVVDGEYRQLNANILQIENEYYSTVRPKQVPIDNEKPTLALRDRGVQYVELRSLDVNAYNPLGIDEQQLRFLETFMVFCLFLESPRIGTHETKEIDQNLTLAAHHGRNPTLCLHRNGRSIPLRQWAAEILDSMQGFSEVLDTLETDRAYSQALESQRQAARDPERTPAAKTLAEMRRNRESFHEFARRLSEEHYDYFNTIRLSDEQQALFTTEARNSWERQSRMEAADTISFEQYLQRYFAQN